MVDPRRATVADALAGELDLARETLEQFAMRLCLDPVVFERHADQLQQFDCVAQCIGEVATILRHQGDPHAAIGAVRLDAVRQRLTDHLPAAPANAPSLQ